MESGEDIVLALSVRPSFLTSEFRFRISSLKLLTGKINETLWESSISRRDAHIVGLFQILKLRVMVLDYLCIMHIEQKSFSRYFSATTG
jgi:hypothetical protein